MAFPSATGRSRSSMSRWRWRSPGSCGASAASRSRRRRMLDELPLIFILVGLAAYAVLAGADFGAGIWVLLSQRRDQELRDHARHAMGPVWEANHVWLIFVIVVAWTAYPTVLASIASTLSIPLFVAAVGIILRGTAYALRAQAESGLVATR